MHLCCLFGLLAIWVKIRLHTENQLPRLSGSALKVPVWGGVVGWWVPTHYQVKLQLMLRLSWAVTIRYVLLDSYKISEPLSEKQLSQPNSTSTGVGA